MKVLLKYTGWIGSPEQEQGMFRILISLAFLGYLLLNNLTDNTDAHDWALGLQIVSGFLIYSFLLFTAAII